ncbi:MAG: hypothetical protein BWY76_01045 [bacterium ADurb.Bin429]|nr:MAG: hypothetical protein BWY76_01045 [bacterium ADurb.Bin429]
MVWRKRLLRCVVWFGVVVALLAVPLHGAAPAPAPQQHAIIAKCRTLLEHFLTDPALSVPAGEKGVITYSRVTQLTGQYSFDISYPKHGITGYAIIRYPGEYVELLELEVPRVALPDDTVLSFEHILDRLTALGQRQYPKYFTRTAKVELDLVEDLVQGDGHLVLRLGGIGADDFGAGWALHAMIDVATGQFTACGLMVNPAQFPALRQPFSAVLARFQFEAAKLLEIEQADVELAHVARRFDLLTDKDKQTWFKLYELYFIQRGVLERPDATVPVAHITYQDTNDTVFRARTGLWTRERLHELRESKADQARRFLTKSTIGEDRWPVWDATGTRLYFRTNREHAGAPWWYRRWAAAVCDLDGTHLRWLDPGWSYGIHYRDVGALALTADGMTLLYTDAEERWNVLNLQTGAYRTVGGRPNTFAQLSVAGQTAAFLSTRHGDLEVYITQLDPATGLPTKVQRAIDLRGEDNAPVLLPDGTHVLFAHHIRERNPEDPFTERVTSQLYRFPTTITTTVHPALVVTDVPRITRISPFPDGTRVLLSTAEGLEIVTLADKTRTKLTLTLTDPTTRQPLTIHEATVSPTCEQIAFTGLTPKDATGKQTCCLYVCNFDGSALRRVTPLEETRVPPYLFPANGNSAYDLAYARRTAWYQREIEKLRQEE